VSSVYSGLLALGRIRITTLGVPPPTLGPCPSPVYSVEWDVKPLLNQPSPGDPYPLKPAEGYRGRYGGNAVSSPSGLAAKYW